EARSGFVSATSLTSAATSGGVSVGTAVSVSLGTGVAVSVAVAVGVNVGTSVGSVVAVSLGKGVWVSVAGSVGGSSAVSESVATAEISGSASVGTDDDDDKLESNPASCKDSCAMVGASAVAVWT